MYIFGGPRAFPVTLAGGPVIAAGGPVHVFPGPGSVTIDSAFMVSSDTMHLLESMSKLQFVIVSSLLMSLTIII